MKKNKNDSRPPKVNKKNDERKVFATISKDVFKRFQKRCNDQGIQDLGIVFASLIEQYADGGKIIIDEKESA